MRIVGGKYKSLRIKTLSSNKTRPTLDKVREAIFSSIAFEHYNSMLDLFSGSGAMGLEAISRGYSKVIFNDKSFEAIKVIKDNLKSLKINNNYEIYNNDYKKTLSIVSSVDLIFIDPPYEGFDLNAILNLINEYKILNDEGMIIIESAKNTIVDEKISNFIKVKEKKYGNSKVSYFRKA